MFLRSNRYDSKAAADQMIKFFELKKFLFGAEKLAKDIVIQDLNADDKKCLEEGCCQLLSTKDAINRSFILFLPGLRSLVPVESEARAQFYLEMRTVRKSEETQRKGIIVIIYAVGEYQDRKKGVGASVFARLATCLPIPVHGIHMCCDDFKEYVILRVGIPLLPAFVRAKFRVHLGTHMEVQYALRGFGIPAGSIPVSPTNSAPLLQNHFAWYLQAAFEDNRDHPTIQKNQPPGPASLMGGSLVELMVGRPGERLNNEARVSPLPGDVLFGHGFKLNPGNVKLHDLIRDIVESYHAVERKSDKMAISRRIVEDCKGSGSRFLLCDDNTGTWSIVADKVARNKVAKAIRNRRRSVEGKPTLSRQSNP
mmetsp:Transcript_41666/g.100352  ORF Transcript_41666/g.100352 Transcript_41666/m.100352 type:complete len:367 (+) Transcript_41666:1-1101(+)